MRISIKIRYEDPFDQSEEGEEMVKKFNFEDSEVSIFEESDLYEDHTTITFKSGQMVDAIVSFSDFERFIMPPEHRWSLKKQSPLNG